MTATCEHCKTPSDDVPRQVLITRGWHYVVIMRAWLCKLCWSKLR